MNTLMAIGLLFLSGPADGPPTDYPSCKTPPPLYVYEAIVRSVYDADTIRADIDLGFEIWRNNQPFRLYGINAPEVRGSERPQGLKSRDWLRERLANDERVILISIRDKAGKYGRYLAVLCDNEGDVITDMVSAGHARWWDY